MKKSVLLLLTGLLLFPLMSPDALAAGRKKKKKKEAVTNEFTVPLPDAVKSPLPPQECLTPEIPLPLHNAPIFKGNEGAHWANFQKGGIDVSHYQGNIDWQVVATKNNVSYVYLKATEGAQLVDDTYRRNLHGARRAGLHVGAYHFFSPTADFHQQFRNFTSTVNINELDLIPIIDIERRGKEPLPKFQFRLRQFLKLVEMHYGVRPILYTSRDFYNKYLAGPFTNYKYMIARYHSDIPQLCDNAAFVMWQYSATSRISGIRGNVDRSCFMDSYGMDDILLRR